MLEFHESDAAEQQAQVPLGDSFEISLRENPTTGFRWKMHTGAQPVCSLTEDEFQPGRLPGAGGIHRWRFLAAQAGETRITLSLERSWRQGAEPSKTFNLRVRVDARS
jgi:predicted secreted protein